MMRQKPGTKAESQRGIALFMVMGSVALLAVLIAELNYSVQISSRMSYNSLDNLKAYYLVKSAFKFSQVRLRAYMQIKNFTDDPANKMIKDALPKGTLDKVWSMPMLFPLPIPKEATMGEGDAIKDFIKESSFDGTYTASITGESTKLNLNNLFMKTLPTPDGPSGSSSSSGGSGTPPVTPPTTPPPGGSGASGAEMVFRPVLVSAISNLIEQKKNDDREFSDVFRNVQGEDVVTAIEYYLFPDKPVSNLPGFKVFKPKLAPFYSLTELHMIPGIEDELYSLLESALTVYTTAGINMNTINKRALISLIPEMTEPEAEDVLRKRDDPDVGQPFGSEDEFWQAISATSAGKSIDAIKKRLTSANIKFITDELAFKISVLANVGQSTRRLEAYVILDPKAAKAGANPPPPGQPGTPPPQGSSGHQPGGQNQSGQPGQQDASAKKPTGINLIYWRLL
ncbi:MAG: general secretion pathway protein GspK [Deltaproteobacteria bacterium]|nr:general secretion pathway protein GspK [Deltaproteobacteria bacterium]